LAELALAADPTDELPRQLLIHHTPLYCNEAFNTADFAAAVATLVRTVPHARWLIDHPEKTEEKDLRELLNTFATSLSLYGHPEPALDFTEIVRKMAPDNELAHQNRMFAALYCGDFRSAWSEENWRAFNRCLETPMWDGVSRHRSIQIINNNGFGDLLQFIRFVPRIAPFFDEIYVFDRAFNPENIVIRLAKC
jgi:hypothetical protein